MLWDAYSSSGVFWELPVVPCLTNFVILQMAATGESFFDAARNVTHLLARHGLNTVRVWWMPQFLLVSSAVITSLVWMDMVVAFIIETLSHRSNVTLVCLECIPL